MESLKEIALENARGVASEVNVIKEEYRNINGIKVIMMKMAATVQGIKFIYEGYYYSNSNGTVQLLTFTSEKLFNQNADNIESLLNGLVEL